MNGELQKKIADQKTEIEQLDSIGFVEKLHQQIADQQAEIERLKKNQLHSDKFMDSYYALEKQIADQQKTIDDLSSDIEKVNNACVKIRRGLEKQITEQQAEIEQLKKQYAIDVCRINQFYFPRPICRNQPPDFTNLMNACLSCPMRETCKLLFTDVTLAAAEKIKEKNNG